MLPSSGIIKMSEINAELKTTGAISLGRNDVRSLAGKLSGIIKMSDLHGKSNSIFEGKFTIGHHIYLNTSTFFIDEYGYYILNGFNFGAVNPKSLFGGNIVRLGSWNKMFGFLIQKTTLSTPNKLKINFGNKITVTLKRGDPTNDCISFILSEDSLISENDIYEFLKSNNGKDLLISINEYN